jgi:hypothetical protein
MSSTAEARFRVQAPNSTPRVSKVIALDPAGEAVVRRLAAGGWNHATFFTAGVSQVPLDPASSGSATDGSPAVALRDLAGEVRSIAGEIDTADLIIMVAGPGGRAQAASIIGEACSRRRVTTTGFIVGVASASDRALSQTLAQVRPWSLMVVMANHDEYIDDMLRALQA